MSTELGPLYHWSPRERLVSIKRLGLVPGRRNHVFGRQPHGRDENGKAIRDENGSTEYRQDSVSFATTPSTAWGYSHGAWKSTGVFDLWEVYLVQKDEVHISPNWGGRIIEVRVKNRIHKSRLIWVGERTINPPK